ncbi:MAG: type II/IV secretion system protein [Verrucomicrobia bacterium]|nr:type II/IV secretion system protein [Verrucomicrobiota bacterium]
MNNVTPETRDVAQVFLEKSVITPAQLALIRRRQQMLNIPDYKAILDLNLASETETIQTLADINSMDFQDLTNYQIPKEIKDTIPLETILHYRIIPVSQASNGTLTVAISEILSLNDTGALRLQLNKRINFVLSTPSMIRSLIRKTYGLGVDTIQKLRSDYGEGQSSNNEVVFDIRDQNEDDPNADTSAISFVDQILLEALRMQTTDIHFEPYPTHIRLRYRIDGILQEIPVPQDLRKVYDSIVSRMKVMAGLDIAERRVPQDGRIAMKSEDEEYALRVSIIPTRYGEAVCLRILGRQSLFMDLSQIGLSSKQEKLVEQLTSLPQGLILISGPTGSGKTTTLYAALAHSNDVGRKIITIENPIEYQLEGVCQIQTRDEAGLTFSSGLRAILRHDPDVVLIGEIRDVETAEIAIRAAQTGHLVLSTIHTNDSISVITRLLEMGIEPFLIGSSLVCSLAQRLARKLCVRCRQPVENLPVEIIDEMGQAINLSPNRLKAWKPKGCIECENTGYRGRVAVYEFFLMNDEIADLITPGVKASALRQAATEAGWRPLRWHGWPRVQSGLISIEELQRISGHINQHYLLAEDLHEG